MKRIKDAAIVNAFGEPYTMTERHCPPDCTGVECTGTGHLIHCSGGVAGCTEPAHIQRLVKPLSGWLKGMLIGMGQLANRNLTMQDNEHAYAILRACNRAERASAQGVLRPEVRIEDDNHAWLMKTLFDDDTGKRLGRVQTPGGEWQTPAGAMAVQLCDPWLSVMLRRMLSGLPLETAEDNDEADETEEPDEAEPLRDPLDVTG